MTITLEQLSGPHDQARIVVDNISVDIELQELIQSLWDRWMITQWSCQGDGNNDAFIVFPDTCDAIMFSLVLESIPVYYKTEVRSLCCGGGAAVGFLNKDIDKIVKKIVECPKNRNIWKGNDLHKRSQELVSDYTKRHFIDKSGFKDVKVFHPPKIQDELPNSKRVKGFVGRIEQGSKSKKVHATKTKSKTAL